MSDFVCRDCGYVAGWIGNLLSYLRVWLHDIRGCRRRTGGQERGDGE